MMQREESHNVRLSPECLGDGRLGAAEDLEKPLRPVGDDPGQETILSETSQVIRAVDGPDVDPVPGFLEVLERPPL